MNKKYKDVMRNMNRALYFNDILLKFISENHKSPFFGIMQIQFSAFLDYKIKMTPWQIFCIDKPEIDEHRSKAWHRLQKYKHRNAAVLMGGVNSGESINCCGSAKMLQLVINQPYPR